MASIEGDPQEILRRSYMSQSAFPTLQPREVPEELQQNLDQAVAQTPGYDLAESQKAVDDFKRQDRERIDRERDAPQPTARATTSADRARMLSQAEPISQEEMAIQSQKMMALSQGVMSPGQAKLIVQAYQQGAQTNDWAAYERATGPLSNPMKTVAEEVLFGVVLQPLITAYRVAAPVRDALKKPIQKFAPGFLESQGAIGEAALPVMTSKVREARRLAAEAENLYNRRAAKGLSSAEARIGATVAEESQPLGTPTPPAVRPDQTLTPPERTPTGEGIDKGGVQVGEDAMQHPDDIYYLDQEELALDDMRRRLMAQGMSEREVSRLLMDARYSTPSGFRESGMGPVKHSENLSPEVRALAEELDRRGGKGVERDLRATVRQAIGRRGGTKAYNDEMWRSIEEDVAARAEREFQKRKQEVAARDAYRAEEIARVHAASGRNPVAAFNRARAYNDPEAMRRAAAREAEYEQSDEFLDNEFDRLQARAQALDDIQDEIQRAIEASDIRLTENDIARRRVNREIQELDYEFGNPYEEERRLKDELVKLEYQFEQGLEARDETLAKLSAKQTKLEVDDAQAPFGTRGVAGYRDYLQRLGKEERAFTEWLVGQNPSLVEGVSFKGGLSPRVEGGFNFGGVYNKVRQLVQRYNDLEGSEAAAANRDITVHELLHSTEMVLPDNLRQPIANAWRDARLARAKQLRDAADEVEQTMGAERAQFLRDAADTISDLSKRNRQLNKDIDALYKQDLISYALTDPSEFWAEEGTKLLMGRFDEKASAFRDAPKGWLGKIRRWYASFKKKAQQTLGIETGSPIEDALDFIIDKPSEYRNLEYLSEQGVTRPIRSFKDLVRERAGSMMRTTGDKLSEMSETVRPPVHSPSRRPRIVTEPRVLGFRDQTPEQVQKTFEGFKNARQAADYVAENAEDDALREIMKRVAPHVGTKTEFRVTDDLPRKNVLGHYHYDETDYVAIRPIVDATSGNLGGMTADTIAHELLHAATVRRYLDGRLKVNQKTDLARHAGQINRLIPALFREARRVNPDLPAAPFRDPKEMITYALTNPEFRAFMIETKLGRTTSYMRSLYNKFITTVQSLLGIDPAQKDAFSRVLYLTDRLMSDDLGELPYRRMTDPSKGFDDPTAVAMRPEQDLLARQTRVEPGGSNMELPDTNAVARRALEPQNPYSNLSLDDDNYENLSRVLEDHGLPFHDQTSVVPRGGMGDYFVEGPDGSIVIYSAVGRPSASGKQKYSRKTLKKPTLRDILHELGY